MKKLIRKILREHKQLLNEQCTCYTANDVGGGAALVYDTCGGSTSAASCSCCCGAWLHPTYVDQQPCLTTSVAPPSGGGNGELGLYADEFLTVDDLDTGNGGGKPTVTGFIERDSKRGNILVPKGGGRGKRNSLREIDEGGWGCCCGWTDYVYGGAECTGGYGCKCEGLGPRANVQNRGRGDKAIDSMRFDKSSNKREMGEREEELNERYTCWHRTGTRSSGKHSCGRGRCGQGGHAENNNEFGTRFECMGSYGGGGGGNDGTTKGGRTSTTTGGDGVNTSSYDNNPISEEIILKNIRKVVLSKRK
jgi:hypothetical protein